MPPPADSRELRVFLVLAEELHFGRAAERLYLTPSRVSQTLRALESRVGGRLFDRTSRRVRLTDLGAELELHVRPPMEQLDAAMAGVQALASRGRWRIRLGCTAATHTPVLSTLVRRYRKTFPEAEVDVVEVDPTDPYAALRAGELDALFYWQIPGEDDLVFGPALSEARRVAVVGRSHPLAGRSHVTYEDLSRFDTPSLGASLPDSITAELFPSGVRPSRRTPPIRNLADAVARLMDGSSVFVSADVPGLHRADLVVLPILIDRPPIKLGLIWRVDRGTAAVRALAGQVPRMRLDG